MAQLGPRFSRSQVVSETLQTFREARRVTGSLSRVGARFSCSSGATHFPLATTFFAVLLCTSPNRCILS